MQRRADLHAVLRDYERRRRRPAAWIQRASILFVGFLALHPALVWSRDTHFGRLEAVQFRAIEGHMAGELPRARR